MDVDDGRSSVNEKPRIALHNPIVDDRPYSLKSFPLHGPDFELGSE